MPKIGGGFQTGTAQTLLGEREIQERRKSRKAQERATRAEIGLGSAGLGVRALLGGIGLGQAAQRESGRFARQGRSLALQRERLAQQRQLAEKALKNRLEEAKIRSRGDANELGELLLMRQITDIEGLGLTPEQRNIAVLRAAAQLGRPLPDVDFTVDEAKAADRSLHAARALRQAGLFPEGQEFRSFLDAQAARDPRKFVRNALAVSALQDQNRGATARTLLGQLEPRVGGRDALLELIQEEFRAPPEREFLPQRGAGVGSRLGPTSSPIPGTEQALPPEDRILRDLAFEALNGPEFVGPRRPPAQMTPEVQRILRQMLEAQ